MSACQKLVSIALLLGLLNACSAAQIKVLPDPQYAPINLKAAKYQPVNNGSIFQAGRSVRLFEDNKAFRVGDLLSITLSEATNASKSAATNTGKDDDISIGVTALLGTVPTHNGDSFFNNTLSSARDFSGTGDSAQSNSLDGEIAVMVTDILPNGTLVVRGEKIIG